MRFVSYVVFSILLITGISCHTTKKSVATKDFSNLTVDSLLHIIQSRQAYNTLHFKGKIKVSFKDNQFEGKINLISKADSLSIISIKKLGIEAGRAKLNNDSICIINRLDQTWKSYYPGQAQQYFSLDWNAYILTDFLLSGIYLTDFLDYSLDNSSENLKLSGNSESIHSQILFSKNKLLPITSTLSSDSGIVKLIFGDYDENQITPIAKEILIRTPDAEIQINWEDLNFNATNKYNFEIPSNYKRI